MNKKSHNPEKLTPHFFARLFLIDPTKGQNQEKRDYGNKP
jgi:hypothetical protein